MFDTTIICDDISLQKYSNFTTQHMCLTVTTKNSFSEKCCLPVQCRPLAYDVTFSEKRPR